MKCSKCGTVDYYTFLPPKEQYQYCCPKCISEVKKDTSLREKGFVSAEDLLESIFDALAQHEGGQITTEELLEGIWACSLEYRNFQEENNT